MISVGDLVLYNHGVHETVMVSDQPLAALVVYVHAVVPNTGAPTGNMFTDARNRRASVVRVNLAVFGKNGDQWQKHSVPVWDHEGEPIERRLAFAYPVGSDPFPEDREPVANDGEPADPDSDVLHPSTRGPNKLASGPTYRATPVEPSTDAPRNWRPFDEDPYASASGGLVNPPIGPEYKPDAPHPEPNAPEPINKVPADSPANPDRPLD